MLVLTKLTRYIKHKKAINQIYNGYLYQDIFYMDTTYIISYVKNNVYEITIKYNINIYNGADYTIELSTMYDIYTERYKNIFATPNSRSFLKLLDLLMTYYDQDPVYYSDYTSCKLSLKHERKYFKI
jgi:hypothetical protein